VGNQRRKNEVRRKDFPPKRGELMCGYPLCGSICNSLLNLSFCKNLPSHWDQFLFLDASPAPRPKSKRHGVLAIPKSKVIDSLQKATQGRKMEGRKMFSP
jgi:hypothetical protein